MKVKSIVALLIALCILFIGCDTQPSQSENASDTVSTGTSSEIDTTVYNPVTTTETLIKYPEYPEDKLPRNYDYKVRVIQGDKSIEIPVYDPVYGSDYFNRTVYNFDQHRRYAEFAFTGDPVTVEITVYKTFSSYTIMPSSKKIPSKINGNVITYTLTEPCTTVLKLGTDKDTHLTIFAEGPEKEVPKLDKDNVIRYEPGYHDQGGVIESLFNKVVYFEAGYHEMESGILSVGSNTIVYLEPGALVKARINVIGQNVRIFGRGAFVESSPTRQAVSGVSYMCMLNDSVNVSLEDIRLLDAHTYNIVITSGMKVNINGVKMLCNQISTDGLSVWDGGVYGMTMDNCYFNISDNVFVVSGGIMSFNVTNTIIMTDYAVFFPQGKLTGDPIVFKDIDILRFGNFMKHEYPEKPSNKEVNLIVENCTAIDNDRSGGFLKITDTIDAVKSYTFKNVSLPLDLSTRLINADRDTKNATITFDNVWWSNHLLTAELLGKRTSLPTEGNEIIFTDTNDSSAVCIKRNTVSKGAKVQNIYVGDLPLSPKYRPYDENGKTYVSAHEILETLRFEDITVENNKLTFSHGSKNYEIEVSDEKAMVSTDELADLINTEITVTEDRIQVTNIERKDDNLLRNPDFEEGVKMPWTTRNFTNIYESEDAYSGKIALRADTYKNGADGGAYQDISNILRQYGQGTYEFTAWVKKASEQCDSNVFRMGIVTDWEYDSYARIRPTTEWQKITYTYTYSGDPTKLMGASFCIGYLDGTYRNILIDNVSMKKIN